MAGFNDLKFHVPLVHVEPEENEEDDDLVTIVEKEKFDVERKVLTITDKFRTVEKILSCVTLEDFLLQGRESLGYSDDEDVYAVLEEDGTEVDEEEYFMMLEHRTRLIVMSRREAWSPADTWQGSLLDQVQLSSSSLAEALRQHLCRVERNGYEILENNMEEIENNLS